jgi:hypothetical protein
MLLKKRLPKIMLPKIMLPKIMKHQSKRVWKEKFKNVK